MRNNQKRKESMNPEIYASTEKIGMKTSADSRNKDLEVLNQVSEHQIEQRSIIRRKSEIQNNNCTIKAW